MACRRSLLLLLLLLVAVSLAAPSYAHDPEREQLEETQREKEEKQAQIDETRITDEQLGAALDEANGKVSSQRSTLEAAERRVGETDVRIQVGRARIGQTQLLIATHRREVEQRAVRAYKSAGGSGIGAVLGSRDLNQAVDRVEMLEKLFTRDREVLDRLKALRGDLVEQKRQLDRARDEAERARSDAARELRRFENAQHEAAHAKAAVDARLAELDAELQALEEAEARIAAAIKRREELASIARLAGINFTGTPSASGFVNPTEGIITSGFGERWGRLHAGIDIANDAGTPIVAAARGIVIDAGWYGGYGLAVLIDHGGSVMTLYAHLSAAGVAYGQVVEQGEYVGDMGSTGNSTGPHLHFEIRIGDEPVDPLAYLP